MKTLLSVLMILWAAAPALWAAEGGPPADVRVYELRTYYIAPGKADALNARFRDHTCKLFEKHSMKIVGFWMATEDKDGQAKLIYILAHDSKEAADKSWKAFRDDPEWKAVKDASEKDGKLVDKVDSVYMRATDYSPIK